jgi:hypothetical protein
VFCSVNKHTEQKHLVIIKEIDKRNRKGVVTGFCLRMTIDKHLYTGEEGLGRLAKLPSFRAAVPFGLGCHACIKTVVGHLSRLTLFSWYLLVYQDI